MASGGKSQDRDSKSSNTSYKTSCTLLAPGLLSKPHSIDEEVIDESAHQASWKFNDLELFLARAKCKKAEATFFESALFEHFEIEVSQDEQLPIAAVSYLGDTDNISDDWVVRADPVHLMPNRDELVLTGAENLSLTFPESEYLVAVLNDFFKDDGWRLEVATPTRWYLHVPVKPEISTWHISEVSNRAIGEFLPDGPDGKRWRRAMNEVQMILHRVDVNTQREMENRLPVNSVWFWGEGDLPEFGHSRWSQVWSSEPVSLGLAHLTRTPREALPVNGHRWISTVKAPGEHLLVYNSLQGMVSENRQTWNKALNDFQDAWLNPLVSAIRDGSLDQLTLVPCNGRTFHLSSGGLKRWWCRRKPVLAYCT
ncbi:hypothetical protein [Kaarinaea lacus]